MIYVRVELWPFGDRTRSRLLGEATLANDGQGSESKGNYNIRLSNTGGFKRDPVEVADPNGSDRNVYRQARVENYPRKTLVMWHLISRALRSALESATLKSRGKRSE